MKRRTRLLLETADRKRHPESIEHGLIELLRGFFRYCVAPEKLIAIFNKVLHEYARLQALTCELPFKDNPIAATQHYVDIICSNSLDIEAISRIKAAIGEAYSIIGDYEKVESFLRQALELCGGNNVSNSPVVVMPLLYLANLEKKRAFYMKAVEKLHTVKHVLYRLGLQNCPFVPGTLVSAALLEAQMGNMKFVKDSIVAIEELTMSEDIMPEVDAFLGYSYLGQGRGDIARHHFQYALQAIQQREFSKTTLELYIKHCGDSSLERILLSELNDSAEQEKESFTNTNNPRQERIAQVIFLG